MSVLLKCPSYRCVRLIEVSIKREPTNISKHHKKLNPCQNKLEGGLYPRGGGGGHNQIYVFVDKLMGL